MTKDSDAPFRCILALDFGLRRIGVATANSISGTASALTTLPANDGEPEWQHLDNLICDWEPELLLVGLPYNTDGSESEMTQKVRRFCERLSARYNKQVTTVDERYTSVEAEAQLKAARQDGRKTRRIKKGDVDSLAAQLIAESWLQSQSNKRDS